jgi:DNA-binding transcriptional regulator LsrR (DeoR family)
MPRTLITEGTARLILKLWGEGMTQVAIGHRLALSHTTVARVIKEARDRHQPPAPGRARP